jgi:hypothetical protein
MIVRTIAGACLLLIARSAGAECVGIGHFDAADLDYICRSESQWAQSVANGDAAVAIRILADDYVGIGSSGRRFTKSEMAAQPAKTSQFVASEQVDHASVRFFGDVAVSQGTDTSRSKDGRNSHVVWTDTWLKRKGKWQIVASQDMVLP